MTSRSYFGKMNSTLGSVVPLAMFYLYNEFSQAGKAAAAEEAAKAVEDIARRAAVKVFLFV